MNKKILLAAGGCAAVCIAAIICMSLGKSGNSDVPEFVYPESSSGSPEASDYEPAAPETAPSEPTAEPVPTLLTSHDPRNGFELSFDGFTINVRGRSDKEEISVIYLESDKSSTSAEPQYNGNEITAAVTGKRGLNDYETLRIGKHLNYRLHVTETGYEPVDTSEISESNAAATRVVIMLPAEGVAEYVDAEKDPERIAETLAQVKAISDEVCEGLNDDYDKLRALSDWVSTNIYYDFDSRDNSVTPETLCLSHVLETHRSVCGGFSTLFSALCAAQGITCCNIRGTALTSGLCYAEPHESDALHEWNYVILDGRHIWIDTVWNTYNSYKNGEYHRGSVSMEYFDVPDEVLALDHRASRCEQRDYFALTE